MKTINLLLPTLLGTLASAAELVPKAASQPCSFCGPPACAKTPKPMNIPNAGFESGHIAPWTPDYEFASNLSNFSVVSTGGNGHALRIDTHVYHNNYTQPTLDQKQLPLCVTQLYRISFDYKVLKAFRYSEIFASILLHSDIGFPDYRTVGLASAPLNATTTGWKHASGPAADVAASTVTVVVGVGIERQPPGDMVGPSVLLDNVSVVPVRSLVDPACPRPPAPLNNSHFQSGQFAPWKVIYQDDSGLNHTVVPTSSSDGDGQPYALRLHYTGNPSLSQFGFAHPVFSVCLGYVYVFELEFNVIKPMAPPAAEGQYLYTLSMERCTTVNSTMQESVPQGDLPFNITGHGTIKHMCRMMHNDAATFRMYFIIDTPGQDAVVDVLGVSTRLATADDFDG